MENQIKLLSDSQLVELANLVEKGDWRVVNSEHKWNGIDLVMGDFTYILQISLEEGLSDYGRFQLFDEALHDYRLFVETYEKVVKYLKENGKNN